MYRRLPDYDEYNGYGRSIDSEFSQIAEQIYAELHKPSWQPLWLHLLPVGIPKKLFRHLEIRSVSDKKDEFIQEGMIGRVSKNPNARFFNDLVEMDFVDYVDYAEILQIQDNLSRFSVSVFAGAKRKG